MITARVSLLFMLKSQFDIQNISNYHFNLEKSDINPCAQEYFIYYDKIWNICHLALLFLKRLLCVKNEKQKFSKETYVFIFCSKKVPGVWPVFCCYLFVLHVILPEIRFGVEMHSWFYFILPPTHTYIHFHKYGWPFLSCLYPFSMGMGDGVSFSQRVCYPTLKEIISQTG